MSITHYSYHFTHLHTARYKGKPAPHKAVLLIAVMRLVGRGIISSSEIELTDELVAEFKSVWGEKLPVSCPFSCSIGQPFFHMQHESFWRLLEHEEEYSMVAEELGLYNNQTKDMPNGYSVNAMRKKFRCAIIEQRLFDVISDAGNRKELEELLTAKYLTYDSPLNIRKIITAFGTAILFVA